MLLPGDAAKAREGNGGNPMQKKPQGFCLRCARPVEQGRGGVLIENGRLIFKADIISDTPEVAYLEGIYVSPEDRGQGTGCNCLSQLTRHLLARTKVVSLLANELNQTAAAFYLKAGFKLRAHY